MGSITRQRDIIDRRALTERLSVVAGSVRAPALDRSAFVAPLKAALTEGRAEIHHRFEATGGGAATIREQCFLMDQLIRALFDLVTQVIQCLAEHRIQVIDFRTELPTLEDVFLKLTGHMIRD